MLATASDDNTIVLWILKLKEKKFGSAETHWAWGSYKILRGHTSDIYDLCWSSDSKTIVSCSVDNSAILFSVEKGKPIQRFEGHEKYVQGVGIDPRMKYIISLSVDRTMRVYRSKQTKKGEYYLQYVVKRREYNSADEDEKSDSQVWS
jgi:chromatin assembly factor 1 subunit B